MNYYFIITIILVVIFILGTFLILKLVNATKEKTTGGMLIGVGLALIPSSFPTFTDKLFSLGEKVLTNTNISNASDWRPRDPRAINNWFKDEIKIHDEKLRQAVRLSKMFCKSRESWQMPGGLI